MGSLWLLQGKAHPVLSRGCPRDRPSDAGGPGKEEESVRRRPSPSHQHGLCHPHQRHRGLAHHPSPSKRPCVQHLPRLTEDAVHTVDKPTMGVPTARERCGQAAGPAPGRTRADCPSCRRTWPRSRPAFRSCLWSAHRGARLALGTLTPGGGGGPSGVLAAGPRPAGLEGGRGPGQGVPGHSWGHRPRSPSRRRW